MEVAALVCALVGAGLTLFQGIVSFPFIGRASLFDMLRFITEPIIAQNMDGKIFLVILFLFTVPAAGIYGGIKCFRKKNGTAFLAYSAVICGIVWLMTAIRLTNMSREAQMFANMFISPAIFFLWTAIYGAGAVCAYMSATSSGKAENSSEPAMSLTESQPAEHYEPITGIETDALIRRAYLFLEDGQFSDAGRYFEQALNQNPEDSRIHLGQLMLARKAHNIDELIDNLPEPLENEKLFQRALRFADNEQKVKLEGYAQSSREKLEQKRIQKEAEQERRTAELEADRERRYHEIVELRKTASTVDDFNKILRLANGLIPYKDTEEIYSVTSRALAEEKAYQDALTELGHAGSSRSIRKLIANLEALDGYKDSAELIEQAHEALSGAEEQERKRRKYIIAAVIGVAVMSAGAYGLGMYRRYSERKAREQAVVQAQEDRKNAIISFFEGREHEAYNTIQSLPGLNNDPVLLLIMSYRDSIKPEQPADINQEHAKRLYDEAVSLANNYPSQPSANKFLGDLYLHGWGVERSMQKSFEHFKMSAESGDTYSQTITAGMYYRGTGTLQDYNRAAELYLKAAEQGSTEAQNNIAVMYMNGQGVERDAVKAYEWAVKAAPGGYMESQYIIGSRYAGGGNYQEALRWLNMSAQQGYSPAQYRLGVMYEDGSGVMKDYAEAAKYYRLASDQEHLYAQEKLARLYVLGLGVSQNLNEAMELYKRAADNGNDRAREEYGKLERRAENEASSRKIAQMIFPVPAVIIGNNVNVRAAPSIRTNSLNRLNSGHPVSISRRSSETDGDWYNVRTASGTSGWVRGDFVRLNEDTQSQYENDKRKRRLPARAISVDRINVRNIPSVQQSRALAVIDAGTGLTVYEIFAGPDGDWFRIRTDSYSEGWVFGKYIEFR